MSTLNNLPAVDVIVVNYNGMRYVPACLASLLRTDYPFFSVTLVDNASLDKSAEWVEENHPQVGLIRNKKNLGFGRSNNIGVKAGSSPLIAFLNSDTVVKDDWLRPLVEAVLEDSTVAAVCSKLLFLRNPRVVNGLGGGMNYVGYGYDIGAFEIDCHRFRKSRDVFFPTAAACVLTRSAFEEIGGFDERFFMYHEDVDLGWRLRLRGHRIKCEAISVVYHAFGGTSLKSGMAFRNDLGQRHALRSLIKNYGFARLSKALPMFLGLGLRNVLRTGSPGFLKCIAWNMKRLPDTLKERKRIQKSRTIRDKELDSLIWQDIRLPFPLPEYKVMDLEQFEKSGNRRQMVHIGVAHSENLGYGWHDVEVYFGDNRTKYRWTKGEAIVYLWNKHGIGNISMDVLALSETLKRSTKFSVSVNGGPGVEFNLASDNWETVVLPYEGDPGAMEIRLSIPYTWCPDDHFGNGDLRRLGIGVKKVGILSDPPTEAVFDGISVIIPTYNRISKLLKVLRALEMQTLDKRHFEVIIVDDGSTDSTESDVHSFIEKSHLKITYLRQTNKKQGAARNLGIRHARMPLLVIVGDDIIPESNFLEEHLRYHKIYNKNGNVAVIGYTTWPGDIRVSPFMRYIGEYGYQFGYSLIDGIGPLPFNFFYTSNLSLPLLMVLELDYIFDEDISEYGWEDIELGYRLEKSGMNLLYNPNAVAYHHHPIDISAFCKRQSSVGVTSRVFLKKHPELDWFLGSFEHEKRVPRLDFLVRIVERILQILDSRFMLPVPHFFYKVVLERHYSKGAMSREDLT